MAGFLFFSKGRNLAWFLLVNLAIFENPQNFSRAARAGFYFFQKISENRSGFLFFSILGGGKNSGFLKRGGFNSNTPVVKTKPNFDLLKKIKTQNFEKK